VKKEKIALLEKDVGEVKPLLLANHELARMQHEEDTTSVLESLRRALERALRDHGTLLVAILLIGFVTWVGMPFKTARLWRKRQRRRDRDSRRVRRAAEKAGLL